MHKSYKASRNQNQVLQFETLIQFLNELEVIQSLESVEQATQLLQNEEMHSSIQQETLQQIKFICCIWKLHHQRPFHLSKLMQILSLLIFPDNFQRATLERCRIYLTKELLKQYSFNKQVIIKQIIESWLKICENRSKQESQNQQSISNGQQQEQFERDKQNSKRFNTTDCFQYSYRKMNFQEQKQLVDRLYYTKNDQLQLWEEMKRKKNKEKELKELQQCTFQPNIAKMTNLTKRSRMYSDCLGRNQLSTTSRSQLNSTNRSIYDIKGFNKAVSRIKKGNCEHKKKNHQLELRNMEKYEQNDFKATVPKSPRLTKRQHEQASDDEFIIQFTFNRNSARVKINNRKTDKEIARNLGKIYSLKKDYVSEIESIIQKQRQKFNQERNLPAFEIENQFGSAMER